MSLTVDTVINELGGTVKVSAKLGLEKSTVSTWRRRGIPPSRWSALVALAAEQGRSDVSFETLASLREPS